MRVRVLGCSGGSAPGRAPSCYLLEGGVAIDAGALASALSLEEQNAVGHVFLTHAHWDHCRDLPLTIINRRPGAPTLRVHALAETIDSLRTHLMNDRVWFRAFDLPNAEVPFVSATAMANGETVECEGYRVTAIAMPHTVPATSFLVDDGKVCVLISSDTGGGGVLKNLPLNGSPLAAVFLEASFPNRMKSFAEMTGHLTPEMLGRECADLPRGVDVIVTHMKPGFEIELAREIADLDRSGIRPCRDGDVFEY
jgi:glyoxylase-like metal-dependent hydrolase (beta-lactamase superfamily II)